MAVLVHEIWLDPDEEGQLLPACILAGPMGDDARRLLGPEAKLHSTFEAWSHFEAMTIYYRIFDRGAYQTDQEWDRQPYPDAWLDVQRTQRPLSGR